MFFNRLEEACKDISQFRYLLMLKPVSTYAPRLLPIMEIIKVLSPRPMSVMEMRTVNRRQISTL